ncbi:RES family NAD+ phosphorylase [Alishewanella sp. HH-ZS]|uniref:RES family NAD+ phosphorylase n=1 Tax=Alishewanella sp. HH-ZS TaxID=1856684 RepID=UPI00082374DF|nr:RES family NAD+ phosphorylase [Alishewanella sp. HH-ZS]OCW96266.1 hypothetical protein A9165_12695 [Alishewanella sp. HH-ZS]
MLKSYDGNLFQVFDEDIGVEGYYNIIRESLFSNPDPDDFVAAIYQARQRIYRKGAIFSRVRKLSVVEFNKFSTEGINVSEIYPPKPDKTSIPQGRFNSAGKRVMYLADHPLIAMKECDVNKGDFFLLSNFSLSKDMNFIEIVSNKDQFSGLVYELLQTKDKRFYPVLNRVNEDFLHLNGIHGIVYHSTKLDDETIRDGNFGIESTFNIAISGDYIRHTTLEYSCLAHCAEGHQPVLYSMFQPLSNKKRKKLKELVYRKSRRTFEIEIIKIFALMKQKEKRNKILLGQGRYSSFNQCPIKVLTR